MPYLVLTPFLSSVRVFRPNYTTRNILNANYDGMMFYRFLFQYVVYNVIDI